MCSFFILLIIITGCSKSELVYYFEYTEINNVETDVQEWFSKYEEDGIYLAKNKENSIVYFYVKSNKNQDGNYKNYNIGIQGNTDKMGYFDIYTESYIANQPIEKVVVIYLEGSELETIRFNDEEISIEQIESIK